MLIFYSLLILPYSCLLKREYHSKEQFVVGLRDFWNKISSFQVVLGVGHGVDPSHGFYYEYEDTRGNKGYLKVLATSALKK